MVLRLQSSGGQARKLLTNRKIVQLCSTPNAERALVFPLFTIQRTKMDSFQNIAEKMRNLLRGDEIHHDNLLFKIHHQLNFCVILVGVLFIFGENYFNGKAIVCLDGDDYSNQFCWLHGTGHIHKDLRGDTELCAMKQDAGVTDRHTSYYLWLPFLLTVCLGLVKLPRVIWKNLCERGVMKNMVGDNKEDADAEKIAMTFRKIRKQKRSDRYLYSFAFCEFLNVLMLVVCFIILNSLLHGDFSSYGTDVTDYYSSGSNKGEGSADNPMCSLFPTVVACSYCTGSIGGGCNDKHNKICILSNNLFNQYFFLILWFWWILLLTISVIGLIYRLAQLFITSFSKMVLQTVYLSPFNLENKVDGLSLSSSECFLLGRLAMNVKGSILKKVIEELDPQVRKQNNANHHVSVEPVSENEDMTSSGVVETTPGQGFPLINLQSNSG